MVAEMVHVLHQRHVAETETETETPSMVTGLVVTGVVSLVIEWVIRVAVVLSVSAHVALALLAGIRRRHAYGCRISILWLAYQGAGWAAPYVLSNLFLGSTPHERQLVVLWLPCVVAHLGGADNITAYSLEDNKLSLRLYLSALLQVMSIAFLLYKQVKIATGSQGALFWASVVMVGVGAFKYLERVGAFWKADFGNMRGSGKNSKPARSFRIQPRAGRKKLLGNEQALLLAHELICITTGAFGDFSFKENDLRDDAGLKQIFSVQPRDDTGWENMRKVVEMELSLMYDILYTKAAVIHVWSGYAVRVVSPVVTATVAVLFWLHSEDGQRRADVVIIYVLLAVTFLLDVRWLFGAAASTWAYAFFNARPASWLHHQVCCSGRWHRLRSFVVSLDLWQHGGGYRLWSGTMGQYNLLQEVTHGGTSRFISCLINTLALEDAWMEYKCSSRLKLDHSKNVEELLFKQIQKAFKMEKLEEKKPEEAKPELKKPEEIKPPVAAQALQRRRHLDEELGFLPEFQELILIWHVTTDVFILASQQQLIPDHTKYVEAIQAVSDYMAFLAAVRPNMLPGLKLRSLHQATRQALDSLWEEYRRSSSAYTGPSSTTTGDKEQLVEFLKNMEHEMPNGNSNRSALYEFSIVLSEGIRFAELLPQVLTSQDRKATLHSVLQEGSNSWKRFMFLIPEMEEEWPKLFSMMGLLELILRSWVRMLIYVSIRCGRDSHAKQLGRGCELTTIVWILSEHAGIFASKPRDGRWGRLVHEKEGKKEVKKSH